MSRFPFPRYPNGWFQVAYSDELTNGGVLPIEYFGKHAVLFRTEDGTPALLDAFCPHLGAHLGHGGKVKGGCIECPFHAWRYDTAGTCVEVPYAPKAPTRAKVKPWTMVERNGLIPRVASCGRCASVVGCPDHPRVRKRRVDAVREASLEDQDAQSRNG
jgi:nitrite reductase/ring-hydroxylating ferredoxin subunit